MNTRFLVTLCLIAQGAAAQGPKLWYTKPASNWNEALPIGNGRMAAMVFGGVETEHLQLNEETIYVGSRRDRVNPAAKAAVPEIRRLLMAGKVTEAEALAGKAMLAYPLRQPPYQPLGDLLITFDIGHEAGTSGYRRELDLKTGIASVEYSAAGVKYRREMFASYPDQVIVMHLTADKAGSLNFRVRLTREADAKTRVSEGDLLLTGEALPHSKDFADEGPHGVKFTGLARVAPQGGTMTAENDEVVVKGAASAYIVVAMDTDMHSGVPGASVRLMLPKLYEGLKRNHLSDFETAMSRVTLQLGKPDPTVDALPTDERLRRVQAGATDLGMVSLYFQYGRATCCSQVAGLIRSPRICRANGTIGSRRRGAASTPSTSILR